ncbi:nucleotidyl transferase AbiEii/AbiGii toxin family protein, partial [Mobiluncus curtisii]
MLARTVDARATKDIDLLCNERSLERALEDLKRLAFVDLGDYMRFTLVSADPIKAEDEYRSGLRVVFQPTLGSKSLQPIAIDLVVDEVPLESAELITPADRIEVEGLPVCDYLVYPVESA